MAASKQQWRLLGQAAHLARSSHTVTAVAGSKLYLFGGEHKSRVPVDNIVHQYDWSSAQWHPLETSGIAPRARVGHAAAAVGKWLYIFGGRALASAAVGDGSKPSWEELGDLHRLDTDSLTWEKVEAECAPDPRSYHAMAADAEEQQLYVFGGCGKGGRLGDLHCYNAAAGGGTWQLCPPPEPAIAGRGGAGLVALHGKVYIIGGFYGKETGDVFCYDAPTRQWSTVEHSLQPPRSVFAVAARQFKIYVFGGELDPSTKGHEGAGAFYGQLQALDTSSQLSGGTAGWQQLDTAGDAPCARGWVSNAMTDKGWFLHGGLDVNNERLSDQWLLELQ